MHAAHDQAASPHWTLTAWRKQMQGGGHAATPCRDLPCTDHHAPPWTQPGRRASPRLSVVWGTVCKAQLLGLVEGIGAETRLHRRSAGGVGGVLARCLSPAPSGRPGRVAAPALVISRLYHPALPLQVTLALLAADWSAASFTAGWASCARGQVSQGLVTNCVSGERHRSLSSWALPPPKSQHANHGAESSPNPPKASQSLIGVWRCCRSVTVQLQSGQPRWQTQRRWPRQASNGQCPICAGRAPDAGAGTAWLGRSRSARSVVLTSKSHATRPAGLHRPLLRHL